jgi:hypothetical protein
MVFGTGPAPTARAEVTRLNPGYAVRSMDATARNPTYHSAIFSNRREAHCHFPPYSVTSRSFIRSRTPIT